MKLQLFISSILLSSLPLSAQSGLDTVTDSVLAYNTTLKALRAEVTAANAATRANLSPDDTNVELGYLWGGPRSLGERKDFSVSQSFDMATLTGAKRSWARSRKALTQSRYHARAVEIVVEARQACIDVIYYNATVRLLETKRQNLETMSRLVQKETEYGRRDALALRAAQLELAGIEGELRQSEAERRGALATLERLCGGHSVTLNDTIFPPVAIPQRFEELWLTVLANHPTLAAMSAEVREA
ncbi:MAG: TolC family protein, partial [Alloprevotella sp.]|nr:TolC family protein [Alloprevotella sp.]